MKLEANGREIELTRSIIAGKIKVESDAGMLVLLAGTIVACAPNKQHDGTPQGLAQYLSDVGASPEEIEQLFTMAATVCQIAKLPGAPAENRPVKVHVHKVKPGGAS